MLTIMGISIKGVALRNGRSVRYATPVIKAAALKGRNIGEPVEIPQWLSSKKKKNPPKERPN
jgi:hypothetical protein